jgi:hypothetical protein
MTNTFILCVSLLTNSQQAVVGQTNGRALVVYQDTVVQRTVTVEDVLLSERTVTNAVPIAIAAPATNSQPQSLQERYPTQSLDARTNSPAFKRRMEREARMKMLKP